MAFETEMGSLDFAACEAHAKTLTDEQLIFAGNDARQTAKIWDREEGAHAQRLSGKYWDEFFTYADEMSRRRKNKGVGNR